MICLLLGVCCVIFVHDATNIWHRATITYDERANCERTHRNQRNQMHFAHRTQTQLHSCDVHRFSLYICIAMQCIMHTIAAVQCLHITHPHHHSAWWWTVCKWNSWWIINIQIMLWGFLWVCMWSVCLCECGCVYLVSSRFEFHEQFNFKYRYSVSVWFQSFGFIGAWCISTEAKHTYSWTYV